MNETSIWYRQQGVRVFPLRPRTKEPACKWMNYVGTDALVAKFVNYGVPLGDVRRPDGTFDCWGVVDTDSPEAEAWVAAHIPETPFKVRTGKGVHRYFRLRRPIEKFIYREGLTIEFRNQGQYVVGPTSIHPSGAVYTADDWSWNWDDIPYFPRDFSLNDGSCGRRAGMVPGSVRDEDFEFPDEVFSGERHDMLFRQLRSYKALGVDPKDAYEFVLLANQEYCKPPLPPSALDRKWFDRGWNNKDRQITLTAPPMGDTTPF
jgi:hypothetical protein